MFYRFFIEDNINVIRLEVHEFLLPGFVDGHTHAAQIPNAG